MDWYKEARAWEATKEEGMKVHVKKPIENIQNPLCLCIMILWMLFNDSTRYTHSYAPPMFCCMNNGLQLKNDLKRK